MAGVYKITFLPFRLFTYYGSSINLGQRLKYHFYNTSKQTNILALFIKSFGWSCFSITIVEVCSPEESRVRESWYLTTFKPLLNTVFNVFGALPMSVMSELTKLKISLALTGRTDSVETRLKKSLGHSGALNQYYGRGLALSTLDAAANANGKKVYVYNADTKTLVAQYRSMRQTATKIGITFNPLARVIDTGMAYKGHLYYTYVYTSNE